MAPPVVALHGIRVVHSGTTVLDVPELAVEAGQVLAVIGPNGAGKSTLLRVMGLLQAPTAGSVRFQGERVSAADGLTVRRRMASVFQAPLLADTTVRANVALGLRFRGLGGERGAARVGEWLDQLGIAHLADRQARSLSGGEAQRTALARALVLDPELLLLDEPFSALDQPTREGVIEDLGRILRRRRTTAVLVTHDRGEAQALGDRVGVMLGGRLLQVDQVDQVFRAPISDEVARFVGVETVLACRVRAVSDGVAVLEAGGRTIEVAQPAEVGEWVRLCVRPEDVTLSPRAVGGAPSSARNRLDGAVVRVTPVGPHVRVTIDCGFPLVALVTQRSAREMSLAPGTPVTAHVKATAPHLLRHAEP
ncbi:MAG TPA: ABC transporter ATP-binding protein [Methylomirabilota bacterium]|nr:ABC transporter ATP-binding protein [Methylomirabilota bacterium]